MPDYSLGKIYKITGNGKVYVGLTTRPLLSQRLAKHKSEYKLWKKNNNRHNITSFECLDDPECKIELLELCPCSSRDELLKCEGKWIRETECVNKHMTCKDRIEYKKRYREENKENIREYKSAYRQANREKINEYKKQHRQNQNNIIFSNIGDGEVAAISE